MMNPEARVHAGALRTLPLFFDAYETAIAAIHSEKVQCQPVQKAPDGIGGHWYGMRVRVKCRQTGLQLYLHTGLIYHPDTRKGLMVEVDRQNHFAVYDLLRENLAENGFDVDRSEADYLKIFMHDEAYAQLCSCSLAGQVNRLRCFFQQAAETIADTLAESYPGFCYPVEEMDTGRELLKLLYEALEGATTPAMHVERAMDADNLGQYAWGSRYWLSSPEYPGRLYAYFGVIFSYQKDPAGIFAEVDRHSNPELYDRVLSRMKADPAYHLSLKEPGFIKLFMPKAHQLAFNQLPRSHQLQMLKDFLLSVNKAFAQGLAE